MEYRDRQALEKFKWGTYISNLREFHLVQKPDSATAKAIQEIQNVSRSTNNAKYKDQNSGFNSYNKKGKGPFLPDGRTICRRFNTALNFISISSSQQCFHTTAISIRVQYVWFKKGRNYGSLDPHTWTELLPTSDFDYNFIIDGVTNGFILMNNLFHSNSVCDFNEPFICKNYKSALENSDKVDLKLRSEFKLGNYILCNEIETPKLVSALGAIQKPNGSVRLIHDASLPEVGGINYYASDTSCKYMDLKDACKIINQGDFLAKVDLSNAYRSVKVHSSNYPYTGLHWRFQGDNQDTFFYDTKLPFGAAQSPSIFQRLSNAHLHKANGLEEPISGNWQIQKVLNGVRRSIGDAQKGAELMTPRLLLMIKANLDLNSQNDICIWSACLMGFYGLLRPGNFLHSGKYVEHRDIQICDVHYHRNDYVIELQWTKTVQFRERKLNIVLPSIVGHPWCPASAIKELLHFHFKRGAKEDALLLCNLSYQMFITRINSILISNDVKQHITGHSFRRGGATWCLRIGMSDSMIKDIGMWRSDAYLRYTEVDLSRKFDIVLAFHLANLATPPFFLAENEAPNGTIVAITVVNNETSQMHTNPAFLGDSGSFADINTPIDSINSVTSNS
ncbi:unnamed protein product [Mytilus coruscus]|uniref:Tyr recombinase domain-containing protein n=1 Tax=Mytilus coruscus TaxID=42192 RepID=A0A6J8DDY3_MYTCO|nr:unnamed protein product [Mytilus coruscus]